jgi:hypothetical protein
MTQTRSNLARSPKSARKTVNWLAVVIGAAIGNGISYGVLSVAGVIFLRVLVAEGIPGNETYFRAYQSVGYLIVAHSIGFACLVPGGYWSARLGPMSSYRNAFNSGALLSLLVLIETYVPYNIPVPLWSQIASFFMPIPSFLLSAYCWHLAHR